MMVKEKNSAGFMANAAGLANKRVLVVGLGMTGSAVAGFLAKAGAMVGATDVLPASAIAGIEVLEALGVSVETGGHTEAAFEGAELIVLSPGVPPSTPLVSRARERGVEVVSDVEFAGRFIEAPVIAVTGTNGKSTTVALLGRVLEGAGKKAFVGGNIGRPAIECLDADAYDWCVLEVSSFHLEAVKTFRPRIGVLLNITEDHLDRYTGFDEYAETKLRLFMNQTGEDYAVLNAGDPVIARAVRDGVFKGRIILFSASAPLDTGVFLKGKDIVCVLDDIEAIYPVAGFRLKGLHNIENIMAVLACALAAGVGLDKAVETARAFEGLPHRMEFIREVDGVRFINDSKGTNVGALGKALEGSGGSVVLIAGGKDKGGEYAPLKALVRDNVKLLVLIGESRFKMHEALGGETETVLAGALDVAVDIARERSGPGDTVLLCPACSSFDMFRDFKERGDAFRSLVEGL